MPRHQIVLDLETKHTFDEVDGRKPELLGVSLVGIYRYRTQDYKAYTEHEFVELENELGQCSRIIGFNIRRFDVPVLKPHLNKLDLGKIPCFDLMEDIENKLGHRISLESASRGTFGLGKSGSGLDAIVYYRQGEMEKLKQYCLDDVRLTKDLYEFGKQEGKIYYLSKNGQNRLSLDVQWRDPDPPANLSLFD